MTDNKPKKLSNTITSLSKKEINVLTKTITGKNCLDYKLYNIECSYTQDGEYCLSSELLKLSNYGICGNCFKIIENYSTSHKQIVKFEYKYITI